MTGEFSANASTLGYFYQARYALFLLLSRAESAAEMLVEPLDDISFERDGNPIELLQTKRHIKSTASLSDASTDLWKTLRIWSVAVAEGRVNLGETILTLVTTGHASKDSAASKLRPHATQNRDATTALEILREVANSSESQTNRPSYEAFLSLSEIQQRALVTNIHLLDSSPNIVDARDQILKRMRISTRPQGLEMVYERVEGWWFNRLIRHLSSESSTPILYRELLDQINDIQGQYHADDLPIDFLEAIAPKEDKPGQDERAFIAQLKLVMPGEPRIRKALNDYYRAFQQRSKWVREELLLVGALEEYEKRLVDEWERLFEAMKEDMSEAKDEAAMEREGQALFNTVQKLGINIQPRCDEPYVMRGSYHILANQLRVGWHAEFLNRLSTILRMNAHAQ